MEEPTPVRALPTHAPIHQRWTHFEIPPLKPAASDRAFEIHMAAVEWSLDPAILITSAEDIQSRQHWSEVFQPYEHQVRNLLTFCRRAPVALVADDVGLGKTITAGLIISELMARGKVDRLLVLAPKILLPQWKEELESKFRIPTTTGSGQESNLYRSVQKGAFVTTYDSARSRIDGMIKHGFDMVVMDEAHKLRNLYGPTGAPKLAIAVQQALAARAFRYVLMLTATPIQNRLWDMYSLIDLLCTAKGHENPLGNPDQFAQRYIADGKTTARRLQPGRKEEFRRHLSQYVVRARRQDCGLHFPTRQVLPRKTSPTMGEDQLLDLVREVILDLNPLQQTSVAQALMSSPAALADQLQNMAKKGSLLEVVAQRATRIAASIPQSSKLRALLELVEELRRERLRDWRIVIFTGRQATQGYIGGALEQALGRDVVGYIRGGKPTENERAIQAYRADPPIYHVLVSTDTGAEGVNLQAGNVLVNFDLPWNPMVLEQRIGRVQRLGTVHEHVIVYNLVLKGSIEERVVARLTEKLLAISDTLGDIEGILEAVNDSENGEGSESMESKIRELVLLALKGRDVDKATERARESIERAKRMYEEEKAQVEQNIGSLDQMHEEGPRMPRLTPTEPRLSERAFTLGALEASGTTLQQIADDVWWAERAGHAPKRVTFQRRRQEAVGASVIGGGIVEDLYRSGSPPFERLVGEWGRSAEHHVVDRTAAGRAVAERLARDWCARYPDVRVGDVMCRPGDPSFHGTVTTQVAVAVSHDKYEKLIDVPLGDASRTRTLEVSEAAQALFRLAEIQEDASTLLRPHVEADPDIQAFVGFYAKRLEEDLSKAGTDSKRWAHVKAQFECTLNARIVAARGVVEAEQQVELKVSVDGYPGYDLSLGISPVEEKVIRAPEEERCVVSGRFYPAPFLATCEVTGKRALKHCLISSELSGRRVLPAATERCAVTRRLLACDEIGIDEASERRVGRDLLKMSAVSGRMCLERDLVRCEMTGDPCLPDEVLTSEVSGRHYRRDQSRRGGVHYVTGHVSEFEQCELSREWLLPEELVASAASGTRMDARRGVKSERPPHRVGLPTEIVQCQASGRHLLRDEVVQSAVSGRWVDNQVAVKSAQSGRPALLEELVTCTISGRRVLPSETEVCAITGQRGVPEFMARSAMSGAWCLPSEAVVSPESGRVVLKTEARRSALSDMLIPIDEGAECTVTGRFAEKSRMKRMDVSKRYVLPENVFTSLLSGRTCASDETVTSDWTDQRLLPDETVVCAWTDLKVCSTELDDNGLLRSVRSFIEQGEGGHTARDVFQRAHRLGMLARLVGANDTIRELESPGRAFMLVRWAKKWLLSGTNDVRIVVYRRSDAGWEPTRVIDGEQRNHEFAVRRRGVPEPPVSAISAGG